MKILSIRCLICVFSIICFDSASTTESYQEGGQEWTGDCQKQAQSPINFEAQSQRTPNSPQYAYNDNINVFYSVSNVAGSNDTDYTDTWKVILPTTKNTLGKWDFNGQFVAMDVLQFHFHSPSEHTFSGVHYDLEVHFVSKDYTTSDLSVTAVFFDTKNGGDRTNAFLDSWALASGVNTQILQTLPAQQLLSGLKRTEIYQYKGSLTTPPCSEIVQWYVINEPQPISSSQLAAFNLRFRSNQAFAKGHGNNRDAQPLNGRTIYYKLAAASAISLVALGAISALSVLFF